MNQPTTITETEGQWARDAAYAHDHLGDPNTFTSEAMEHIPASEILADAAQRMSQRRFALDLDRMIHQICGIAPRKDPQ